MRFFSFFSWYALRNPARSTGRSRVRIPGLRQQLFGLGRIVGIDRRLPVEVEARGDDAPGDLGKPEGLRLVDRLAIDGVGGGEPHAAIMPRRARVPLVGEDQPVSARERRRVQGE